MKKHYLQFLLVILFFSLLISCNKSTDPDVPEVIAGDKYLVNYTFIRNITQGETMALYGLMLLIYPDVSSILTEVKVDSKLYAITYNTTFGTKKVVASGLVSIPVSGGPYPLLSFQNGTNTVYADAPTSNPISTTIKLISGFASSGFVVTIPDYLGFGASTNVFHPYLHKESTVTSILDMFRAVKELSAKSDLSMKLSSDVYLMGYSQGGLSTLQLDNAIETTYASEFNLKAVGCGAGPYYLAPLTDVVVNSTTFNQPYYIAYIMKGFKSASTYANPYTDIFNEPYASRIDGLFNGINSGSAINAQLTTTTSQLFTTEFRTTWSTNSKFKPLRDALTASSVPAWKIKTPLILTHGQADTDVSPLMSQQLYNDLIKLDATLPVTYIPMPGLDHSGASAPSIVNFVKRFLAIRGKV